MLSGFTDERARRLRRARRQRLQRFVTGTGRLLGAIGRAIALRLPGVRGSDSDHDPGTQGAGRPSPRPHGPPQLSAAAAVALPSAPDDPAYARFDRRRPGSR